jgi:uncharacterized protein (TIGR00730 family)
MTLLIKRVSVFGGSSSLPGEPDYEAALHLGCLLGSAGYTVLTGGYMGSMEAVSRGASENGGHVIGVTCDEIEAWRPTGPNYWVEEEIRSVRIIDRLSTMIEACDAAIALPGGIGTLTEISLMWTCMSIRSVTPKPLILVGSGWQDSFQEFFQKQAKFIPEQQHDLLVFAADVESAFFRINSLN